MSLLSQADWQPFFGNNTNDIPFPTIVAGGSVSFKKHIGKPLSQALWEDLIHRFCINGLCIYGPSDYEWTIGWPDGHCTIYLDENKNVDDIHLKPYGVSIYESKKAK